MSYNFFSTFHKSVKFAPMADLWALRTAPFGSGVSTKWQTHNLLGLLGPFCFHLLEWKECNDSGLIRSIKCLRKNHVTSNMILMVLNKSRERQDFYSVDKYLHFNPYSKGTSEIFGRNNFPREGNKNEA